MSDGLPDDFDDFEELVKTGGAAQLNPCTLRVGTLRREGWNTQPKIGLIFRAHLLPEDVVAALAGPRFSIGYSATGRVLQLRAHAEGRYELAKMPRSTHTYGVKVPFPSAGIRYEEGEWSVMPVALSTTVLRIPVPEALHPRSIAHQSQAALPAPEAAPPAYPAPEAVPERVGNMRLTPTERTILGCFLARAHVSSRDLVEIVRSCGGAVNSAESAGTLAERYIDRMRPRLPDGVRLVQRNGGYDMPLECKPVFRKLIRESGQ